MSARTILTGEADVRAAVGSELGGTDWFDVTAERLAQFAEATGGAGAAYFAISLSNMFLPQIVEVRGFAMGINYGTDAVRFERSLAAGDRARARASLVDVVEVTGGIQTRMVITIEVEVGEVEVGEVEVGEVEGGEVEGGEVEVGEVEGAGLACSIESLSRWLQ